MSLLLKIAACAGAVSLALASPAALAYEPIISAADAHTLIHPSGVTDEVLATGEQTDGQFSMIVLGGAKGAGPCKYIAHAKSAETFYVLEGQVRFFVNDKTIEGGPGTFVSVPATVRHGLEWLSDARILVTYSPPGYEHFFMDWDSKGLQPGPELGALEAHYGLTRSN